MMAEELKGSVRFPTWLSCPRGGGHSMPSSRQGRSRSWVQPSRPGASAGRSLRT